MLNKILLGIISSLVVVILIILLVLVFHEFEDVAPNEDAKNNIHKTGENIFQSINSIISWDSILGIILERAR